MTRASTGKRRVFWAVVAACAGIVGAAPARATTKPSLDQIAAMQTFLRAEIQGPALCPETTRDLPPEGLATLPQLLLAEFRTRWDGTSLAEREKFFSDETRIANCRARCRCETYLDWIESAATDAVSPKLAEAKRRIERAALPKAKGRTRACAEANREWICRHPFFKDLVEAGKQNAKSGT